MVPEAVAVERCPPASGRIRTAVESPVRTAYQDERRALLEEECSRLLDRHSSPPLSEMMSYSLAGGKRLRGLLLLAVAESCSGSRAQALEAAVAIELIHGASLVVDDLPAVDDTAVRRGRPSLHRRFGDAAAILTAHALVATAFEVLTRIPAEPQRTLRITRRMATAIGARGMALGELVELHDPGESRNAVRALKTGSLFQVAAEMGAVLAGAEGELPRDIRQLGRRLGFCYQIIDDLRDDLPEIPDPDGLWQEGRRCWRECSGLFDDLRRRLPDARPLDEWLGSFRAAAEVVGLGSADLTNDERFRPERGWKPRPRRGRG